MNGASTVRQSFVFAVAHSPHNTIIMNLDHHSWSPVYISIVTQEDTAGLQFHAVHPPPPSTHPTTMGNFTHASTRKATDPPTHARPTHKPSFPSTQATRTKIHVSRLAHRITYLFVIIRLTDTSFFLSLSCSV